MSRKSFKSLPPSRDYDVGYGKPPASTRFKPGQSGNPKGRPKGALNRKLTLDNAERMKGLILQEAYRTIPVQERGGPVEVSMIQAVIRSIAVSAAKGDSRSQRLFAELVLMVENDRLQLNNDSLQSAITYKENWTMAIRNAKRNGLPIDIPIPHPDHVHIDYSNGTVEIDGPMTEREKAMIDQLKEHRETILREQHEIYETIEQVGTDKFEQAMQDTLETNQRTLELIEGVLPLADRLENEVTRTSQQHQD